MIRTTLLAAILSAVTFSGEDKPKVIEIGADTELIPEGIAVHPQTGTIYLSSLHQNKIVAVSPEGQVRDLISPGAEGYRMGLGMKTDAAGKTLWACTAFNDSTTHQAGLYQVDLQTGKVLRKFIRNEQQDCFLNDLVIDSKGNIYLTDTYQGSVFRWDAQTAALSPWLQDEQLKWANGIALSADEQTLFVASGRYGIQKINIATKKITPIAGPQTDFYAIDGLVRYQNSLIGVVGWPQNQPQTHRVLRFHLGPDHMLTKTDTIDINTPYLNCPTTAAITNDQLFVLARTNLGVYNRHQTSTAGIKDSLQKVVVLQYALEN
jgi:sugar lactone lactonase YvrE